jgi:hypothetical protein
VGGCCVKLQRSASAGRLVQIAQQQALGFQGPGILAMAQEPLKPAVSGPTFLSSCMCSPHPSTPSPIGTTMPPLAVKLRVHALCPQTQQAVQG